MSQSVTVPVLAAGRLVLFPGMRCTVHLNSGHGRAAMRAAREHPERSVAVFASRGEGAPDGGGVTDLHRVGTLARVVEFGRECRCGRPLAELQGEARVCVSQWRQLAPFRAATCSALAAQAADAAACRLALEVSVLTRRLRQRFPKCLHTLEALQRATSATSPEAVLGAAGVLLLDLPTVQRQQLLELDPLSARLEAALVLLHERLARGVASDAIH